MKYQVSSDPITRATPILHADGWKTFEVTATGTGILKYQDATKKDGFRKELRHPADVFHPDSLTSLVGIPATDLHPTVGKVDQDNRGTLQKGTVHTKIINRFSEDAAKGKSKDITIDKLTQSHNGLIDVICTVHDRSLLERMDAASVVNTSMGYDCAMLPVSGTWKGERFDCIQKLIRYNHLALLPDVAGRHPNAKAHCDSANGDGFVDVLGYFDNGMPETYGDTQILKVDDAALEMLSRYDSLVLDDKDLREEIYTIRSDTQAIPIPVSYYFIDRVDSVKVNNDTDNHETMTTNTNTVQIQFGDTRLDVSSDQFAVLNTIKTNFENQIADLTKRADAAEELNQDLTADNERLQGRYDALEYDKNQLDVEIEQLRSDAQTAAAESKTDEDDADKITREDAQAMAVEMAEKAIELCMKADSLGFTLSGKNAVRHADMAVQQITKVVQDKLISTGRFDAADLEGKDLATLELLNKGVGVTGKTDSSDLTMVSNIAGTDAQVPASFSTKATSAIREANSSQFGKGFTTLSDLQGRTA